MSETVFVDTNVLVYARDRSEPDKHARALEWMAALWESGSGRLSYQVLTEYYVTLTRKLDPPREVDEARADVTSLVTWSPAVVDVRVVDRAWEVQDRYGFSWWDALIVAAALTLGCAVLLTEDLSHGQTLEGLRIVNPFRAAPGAVLGSL